MDEIENWVNDDPDGKDRCWKNTNTGTILGIMYNEEEEFWEVTGQNSRLYEVESEEEAREKAYEFMRTHPRPSPMV
jgi:hypothetical protein